MEVCTIIAKNYVAHARVLARSLSEHNPGARLWTLIIDDFAGYIDPAHEPFEVLTPADVGCGPFIHMALRYSVLELSTAVKPWLLRHLLDRTGAPVTYLDPDIKVYGSLEPLAELAARHKLVLIPHNRVPIPADGRKPSQVDVMIAGVYNLGYVSLAASDEIDALLDWWSDRLRRDCRVDPVWGYFVDQRWFDLAPGFLSDLAIVRDPEYNVAYWNLHDRELSADGGRYQADGCPIAFFHFSGFDPAQPLVLSRHQDRVSVLDDPVLERVLSEYASDVNAQGHPVSRTWPYTYSALGDGTMPDDLLRDLYDEYEEEHDGAVASPFTLEGTRRFDAWLAQTAPDAPAGMNRVLARVYDARADVRAAYPDAAGVDRAGLMQWADTWGRREERAIARVLENGNGSLGPSVSASALPPAPGSAVSAGALLRPGPWGINLVGSFHSEGAHGDVARGIVDVLDATSTLLLPIDQHAEAPDGAFPVNLICVDDAHSTGFARAAGAEFFAGRYSIALWLWDEVPPPQDRRDVLSVVEEVWAPSEFVARALAPIVSVPITTIRLPVQPPSVAPRPRAELGLTDEQFVFHCSLDSHSELEGQNPLAAIEAFSSAFSAGESVRLLVSCPADDSEALAAVREHAAEHPGVLVVDRAGDPGARTALTSLADCYVSAHRIQAFGYPLAEAMWLGKPTIATSVGGNLDYMTNENSYLVQHDLASVMQEVFSDHDGAGARGARAASDIRRTHSPERAEEAIERRLESIRATGRARRGYRPAPTLPPSLAKLSFRIRQGPTARAVGGRGGRARRLAQRALLRAVGPYAVYQQSINRELLAGVGEVSEALADARREALVERARWMAELRRIERELRSAR